MSRWLAGIAGAVLLVIVWWVLADTAFAHGGAVPTPWQILYQLYRDGWSFYWPNLAATLSEAARGFAYGAGSALVVAAIVLLVPAIETLAVQLGLISYCLPIMAVGPLLVIVFSGRTPMVMLSALSVFFPTLIGGLVGLRSADPAGLDLVRAYGGGRVSQLRRVRVIAAMPAVLAALKIAAPAAVLGAIVGEFLGSVDVGLGVAMTTAQEHLDVSRTWGIALVAGLLASVLYGIFSAVSLYLTPLITGTAAAEGTSA